MSGGYIGLLNETGFEGNTIVGDYIQANVQVDTPVILNSGGALVIEGISVAGTAINGATSINLIDSGTDNRLARYNGANAIQPAITAAIDDSDNITGVASITASGDMVLNANSISNNVILDGGYIKLDRLISLYQGFIYCYDLFIMRQSANCWGTFTCDTVQSFNTNANLTLQANGTGIVSINDSANCIGTFSCNTISSRSTDTNLTLSGNGTGIVAVSDNLSVSGTIEATGISNPAGALAVESLSIAGGAITGATTIEATGISNPAGALAVEGVSFAGTTITGATTIEATGISNPAGALAVESLSIAGGAITGATTIEATGISNPAGALAVEGISVSGTTITGATTIEATGISNPAGALAVESLSIAGGAITGATTIEATGISNPAGALAVESLSIAAGVLTGATSITSTDIIGTNYSASYVYSANSGGIGTSTYLYFQDGTISAGDTSCTLETNSVKAYSGSNLTLGSGSTTVETVRPSSVLLASTYPVCFTQGTGTTDRLRLSDTTNGTKVATINTHDVALYGGQHTGGAGSGTGQISFYTVNSTNNGFTERARIGTGDNFYCDNVQSFTLNTNLTLSANGSGVVNVNDTFQVSGSNRCTRNYAISTYTANRTTSSTSFVSATDSVSITTTGGPIYVEFTLADLQMQSAGTTWCWFTIYRGLAGTNLGDASFGLGMYVATAASINNCQSIRYIDAQAAGTYTYYLYWKVNAITSTAELGEAGNPSRRTAIAIELQ